MSDLNKKSSIDYESEIANLNAKHKEEVSYLKNEIDGLYKQLSIFELKWSVVEMIFRK